MVAAHAFNSRKGSGISSLSKIFLIMSPSLSGDYQIEWGPTDQPGILLLPTLALQFSP